MSEFLHRLWLDLRGKDAETLRHSDIIKAILESKPQLVPLGRFLVLSLIIYGFYLLFLWLRSG